MQIPENTFCILLIQFDLMANIKCMPKDLCFKWHVMNVYIFLSIDIYCLSKNLLHLMRLRHTYHINHYKFSFTEIEI